MLKPRFYDLICIMDYMRRGVIILVTSMFVNLVLICALYLNRSQSPDREWTQHYPLLSRRLSVENHNDILINFVPLRSTLREYVGQIKQPTGMYFEYLPSGVSIGINDQDTFFGASLLKLPVVMKTYKLIEQGKLNKTQQITITEDQLDSGFGALWEQGAGTVITVEDAMKLAITQSDNTADNVLRALVQSRPVSDVFDYLDIPTDQSAGPGAGITPKGFSSTLRALYLSSYLSYENSNALLKLMTMSPYSDRIVAGLPSNIQVAHKVGVYKDPATGGNEVHSDCGIVYVPQRPYMLCIISRANIEESTNYMKTISKLIYDYVSSVN